MGAACSKLLAFCFRKSPTGEQQDAGPFITPGPVSREPPQDDNLEADAQSRDDCTKAPAPTAPTAAPAPVNAPRAVDARAPDVQTVRELSCVEVELTLSWDVDAQEALPATKTHPAVPQAPSANAIEAAEVVAEGVAPVVDKIPDWVEQLRQSQGGPKADKLAAKALAAAPGIMELLDKAVAAYQAAKAKGKPPPAVQELQVAKLNRAQETLIKYSALGKVLLDAAGAAASSFPFGAPVAALLGAVYGKAVQCAKNRGNCYQLVLQIKRCDSRLAGVVQRMSKQQGQSSSARSSSSSLSEGVLEGIASLYKVIQDSAAAIAQYSDRGCIMHFITSGSNEQLFQRLDKRLCDAMGQISFEVSMATLASDAFKDESAELRAAVCRAAGLQGYKGCWSAQEAEEALKQLCKQDSANLRLLLQQHGSFSDQVVAQELQDLAARVTKLESRLAKLEAQNKALQARGPVGMASRILWWWESHVSEDLQWVPWSKFKQALIGSMCATVDDYGQRLCGEVQAQGWALPAGSNPPEVFLDRVLLRLLDTDGDQHISMSELKALQLMAAAHEAQVEMDMGDLLECAYACCDRTALQLQLSPPSSLASVTDKLQARIIISTYRTTRLLDEYVPGTRAWVCEKIDNWRAAAAPPQQDRSRIFLLLADPGMGKSVCSAVLLEHLSASKTKQRLVVAHHFFKVGQQRGEGKAMIRCLAQQLCDQLPGLADLVEQQIQDLPDLTSLSMAELFDKLLLAPLKHLDQQLDQQQQRKPECLLLLDALDESTDNNQGWQPVCNLVAAQFQQLPSWVYVLVTGRPQVESRFDTWQPAKWIAATDQRNHSDLRAVLLAKLQHSGRVDGSLVNDAADLLLRKSQGQFIYAKYVLTHLEERAQWTLQQLQQLPDGLQQAYRYQLETILAALHAERPELVALFKKRLLPMLAVMKEALNTNLLAWLVQGNLEDVALLLRLLYSLFPSRTGADGTMVFAPYHKSVQDFLLLYPDQSPASSAELRWRTPAAKAHRLFVARLLPELQKPQLTHWRDACGPQVLTDLPAAQQYCLQYAVDHIALAKDWTALHQLLWHLPGLKAVLEVPGQVYKLILVLAEAADSRQTQELDVFVGVQRFLRASSCLISQDPHSIMQEMAYCPRDCVLGDLCQQHFMVKQAIADAVQHQSSTSTDFWRGALLSLQRAATFPPEVALLQGHTTGVTCCTISPDGRTLVSGSEDQSLKVWDLSTGQLRTTLEGHENGVTCCAITPDGQLLVSGSEDTTLKVWDLYTGQLQAVLQEHSEAVLCCAISPQAGRTTLVSGSRDGTLMVWDLSTGKLRSTLQERDSDGQNPECCAISPDGQTLVSGSTNGKLMVWDLQAGQPRTTLAGHKDLVSCCAISPNGQLLVSASKDQTLKVWNLATGGLHTSLTHTNCVTACAITPDMSMVMSAEWWSDTWHVWDLSTGQLCTTLKGHEDGVTCCAITPDGQTLVSGSMDKTLKVWDLSATLQLQQPQTQAPSDSVLCCAVSAHVLVLGWTDRVQVWDLLTGELRITLKERMEECTISPDGQTVVLMSKHLGGGTCSAPKVWDLPSRRLRTPLKATDRVARCCAISPDSKTLVFLKVGQGGEEDWDDGGDCSSQESVECSLPKGDLHVWDLPTWQLRTRLAHEGGDLSCCAISADGRWLVCGSSTSIKVWDVATGMERATLADGAGAQCCAISPDGHLLVCGFYCKEGDNIKVWDLRTGQPRMALRGHYGNVTWCAISMDGKTLTSCSFVWNDDKPDDQAVQVWDPLTGKEHSRVEQGADRSALSPDGQLLVCASVLDKLKAWVLMGNWQQGVAPPPYNEAMSLHRWCPGAPGFYLL